MAELFGWAGNVLLVDLSNGKITRVPTTDYQPEDFIGGAGLNTKIFWELGCPEVEAFHPDNPMIIAGGPLSGLYGPFGKGAVCSISPQCYPWELFSYSSFGGRFPTELKFAGYDALVIVGKSEKPVYLSIHDGEVRIKSARLLWGMETLEVQQALMGEEAGSSMLVIGPAGENLSRIAVILSETNFAAGQGGFGAVMGSKKLKAITVRGSGGVKVARPDEVMHLAKAITSEKNKAEVAEKVNAFRVPYTASEETRNIFTKNYYVKQSGCYGCPAQCISINDVPGIGICGSKCMNWQWSPMFSDKAEDIWEANVLMQKLGINSFDIICGIPVLLQLAHKEGSLTTKEIINDLGLPATRWLGGTATDHEFLTNFLHRIADGETPYGEGTPRFTEYFRHRLPRGDRLMHMQEELYTAHGYPYHYGSNLGSVLHWATDSRDPIGSAHEYINPPPEVCEHFGLPPYSSYQIQDEASTVYEGAEKVTAWVQENQCLKNSLTLCEIWSTMQGFYDPPDLDLRVFESRMFSAVTGINMDTEKLAKAGERIWNLRRAVMVKRENRTREDDTINEPYFNKPFTSYCGRELGNQYEPINRSKFETLKDRYYKLRGWDVRTGWPTRDKLEELGLKDIADKLKNSGRLPSAPI